MTDEPEAEPASAPDHELGALTAAFVQLVVFLETKGVLECSEFAAVLKAGSENLSVEKSAQALRELASVIRPPGPRLVE